MDLGQELDWLRQDISVLNVQVDRRHAFLTNVRNRARAHADLCEQVERRAGSMREQVHQHREQLQAQHDTEQMLASRYQSMRSSHAAAAAQLFSRSSSAGAARDWTGGMEALLMRTRREALRAHPPHLEPFPLEAFESRAYILNAGLPDDEVHQFDHYFDCQLLTSMHQAGKLTLDETAVQCAVCLEGMSAGERVITLRCKHVLHWQCIQPWLVRKVRRETPVC